MVGSKKAVRGFHLSSTTKFKIPGSRSLGDINKGSDSRISGKRKTHLNTQRPKTKSLSKSKTRKGRVGGRLN